MNRVRQIQTQIVNIVKSNFAIVQLILFLLFYIPLKGLFKILVHLPISNDYINSTRKTLNKVRRRLIRRKAGANTTSISNLVDLALSNMTYKLHRTSVTIIGVAIGFGTIVTLVSVGFGLQQLVISRVARLEELRQADVYVRSGSNLYLDDSFINRIRELPNVVSVMPMISIVSRIGFEGSVTDIVAYGVSREYLDAAGVNPISGELFQDPASGSGSLVADSDEREGIVITGLDELEENSSEEMSSPTPSTIQTNKKANGQVIREINFTIEQNRWIRIRNSPSTQGKILGYTKYVQPKQTGEEVWGDYYLEAITDDPNYARWIKSDFKLWEQVGSEYREILDEDGLQENTEGYTAEIGIISIEDRVSTAHSIFMLPKAQTITPEDRSNQEGDEWVFVEGESDNETAVEYKIVEIPRSALRKAIVNEPLLKIINVVPGDAVGKQIQAKFVLTGELAAITANSKIESENAAYNIVGVVSEANVPYMYVSIDDLKGIGIERYSQLKVVVSDESALPLIRSSIESMGYTTTSVADTVSQIDAVFKTVRLLLAVIGSVALSVASLGMFNTLTISLLERIKEIGLMKAMGMRSSEVKELLLTESIIMGFLGGLAGVVLGIAFSKLIELTVSFIATTHGEGYIRMTQTPFFLVAGIITLSVLIGILTGIYPARRAQKISALDALRYE